MRKIVTTIIFLLLPFFVNAKEKQNLEVKITKLTLSKNILTINYKVTNLSSKTLWVCSSNSQNLVDSKLVTGFVLKLNNSRKLLIIGVHNIDALGFMVDGPLGANYTPLSAKETQSFTISIKFPIKESRLGISNFENKLKTKKLCTSLKEIEQINFVLGYYNKDLFILRRKCCYFFKSKPDLIRVSYKWARKNKEKTIKISIDLKRKKL